MLELPSLIDFGGVDDGLLTDDTAAFNALAAHCNSTGVPGFVPATQYGFATNGGHGFNYGLVGVGGWRSKVFVTHPTNDVIIGSDFYGGNYDGVYYFASVTRTAGRTIVLDTPPGSFALGASIRNNKFQNGFIDVHLKRANAASIEGNQSVNFHKHFVVIENVDFPDNGDHSIIGNLWDTADPNAGAGILQYSAGGARIINNKGGRGAFGYQLELQGAHSQSTSIIILQGNSFENHTIGNVRLGRGPASSAEFFHVIINGNEFAGVTSGNAAIELDGGVDFVRNIVFSANVLQFTGCGLSMCAAKAVSVSSNVFQSYGGASLGIQSYGSASGRINDNVFFGVTTPISNTAPNVLVS